MDEMVIASSFMQNTITRILTKIVAKKLGINLSLLKFDDPVSLRFDGEEATVHVSVTAKLPKEDLSKLLKDI